MIRRAAGLTLVIAFLLLWSANSTDLIHRLLLPALLAVGAWLVLNNIAAVAIAVAALAGIHSEPGANDPVRGVVYPAIAATAAITAVVVFARRFVVHMHATREARHARRNSREADDTD